VSELAQELESAGIRNDLAFIEEHNAEFMAALEALLEKINGRLSLRAAAYKEADAYINNVKMFKSELGRLKAAIDEMDGITISEATDKLQKSAYTEVISDVVKDISNKILMAEYDEAVALIESLSDRIE